MSASDFKSLLREELEARGLLGTRASRAACAAHAADRGERALAELAALVGEATMRRALSTRRGEGYVTSYRYVLGYGSLMTEFLVAPVGLDAAQLARVAALGALANLIVTHFDELVDGGSPRSLLLPQSALAVAPTRAGRALLRAGAHFGPPSTRLIVALVALYFARAHDLQCAAMRPHVRRRLSRTIMTMYAEEGRTPREWRRLRGGAAFQKKTALPLVALGLPAWLASAELDETRFQAHCRWLVRVGKFVRWVDDAADVEADGAAGAANLVRHALARRRDRPVADEMLAAGIAKRGRRLVEEWSAFMTGSNEAIHTVLSNVLVAWVGEPEYAGST